MKIIFINDYSLELNGEFTKELNDKKYLQKVDEIMKKNNLNLTKVKDNIYDHDVELNWNNIKSIAKTINNKILKGIGGDIIIDTETGEGFIKGLYALDEIISSRFYRIYAKEGGQDYKWYTVNTNTCLAYWITQKNNKHKYIYDFKNNSKLEVSDDMIDWKIMFDEKFKYKRSVFYCIREQKLKTEDWCFENSFKYLKSFNEELYYELELDKPIIQESDKKFKGLLYARNSQDKAREMFGDELYNKIEKLHKPRVTVLNYVRRIARNYYTKEVLHKMNESEDKNEIFRLLGFKPRCRLDVLKKSINICLHEGFYTA